MKILILFLFLSLSYCDEFLIKDFSTDIFSKIHRDKTQKIKVSMSLKGRDLKEKEPYIYDSLNIVISSFYAQDLLTSVGKDKFKKTFIKYALKSHDVNIDDALILSIELVDNLDLEKILDAIKSLNTTKQDKTSLDNFTDLNDIQDVIE